MSVINNSFMPHQSFSCIIIIMMHKQLFSGLLILILTTNTLAQTCNQQPQPSDLLQSGTTYSIQAQSRFTTATQLAPALYTHMMFLLITRCLTLASRSLPVKMQ